MDSLESYLQAVMDDMSATWPKYDPLRPKDKKGLLQPIPFFGDVNNAQILTVGVNPSSKEFSKDRLKDHPWPPETDKITANDLNNLLENYFASNPYKWFDNWEEAFKPLGVSYKDGAAHLAAHLDLSPRVTASMGGASRDAFLTMMKEDVKWFFKLLPDCKAARLILIAGSVTNLYRMDEFLECIVYRYGYKLDEPPTPRGEGFGFNCLRGPGVDLPVFFSSLSPSSRKPEQKQEFIDRVKNNQVELRRHINKSLA